MASISLNIRTFVTLCFKLDNYPLWREQILALAESQDLVNYLTGNTTAPLQYDPTNGNSSSGKPDLRQDYLYWCKADRLLCGWIIGTLSEEAVGLVVGLETSHHVWHALQDAYAQNSQEREFHLTQQLTYLRKETSTTLADHLQQFKGICDSRAAFGKPVTNKLKIFSLLSGLGPKYEPFTTSMLKPPMPTYAEIVPLLQGFEIRSHLHDVVTNPTFTLYGQKIGSPSSKGQCTNGNNMPFSSKGRGFTPAKQAPRSANNSTRSATLNPTHQSTRADICQICGKKGHMALKCWHRFNHLLQPEDIPQALAVLTLESFRKIMSGLLIHVPLLR